MSWFSNSTDYHNATALQCQDQGDEDIFWICIAVLSFVFGFPGAVTILLALFQKGRKGIPFSPMDVFVLNITVMDGVYLLFLQPDLYNYMYWHNIVFEAFFSFLYSFNLCGRPLFITCMCLDCYVAVVHPVTYRAKKSLTPRVLMVVGVWIVTVIYGCYFAIIRDHILINPTPVLFFVWTIPVIGYCDFSILWTLKRSSPGGRNNHPQKKKALQIIINNLVITLISYLPPVIAVLIFQFLRLAGHSFQCFVVMPVIHVTVVTHIVTHLLYLYNLGKLDWLKCWKLK